MNNLTKIIKKQREELDYEFIDGLDCGNSECGYEGTDKCFHGTEHHLKQFFNSNTTELLEGVKKMLEEMKIVEFAYFGCNCCEHKMSCNPPQPNGGHNSALATAISNIDETLNINK